MNRHIEAGTAAAPARARLGWLVVFGIAWAAGWVLVSRRHLLDDTFIYLRYADATTEAWRTTFDGKTQSYGTSSYLYFLLLWITRWMGLGWLVPKALSVVSHLALLGILSARWVRTVGSVRAGYGLLLLVFSAPMAFRWLGDGMETALSLLASVGLSLWWVRSGHRATGIAAAAGILAGWLVFLLRPEFLIVVCALTGYRWMQILLGEASQSERRTALLHSLHLLCGAALGVVTVWMLFGHISPDTSVASGSYPQII